MDGPGFRYLVGQGTGGWVRVQGGWVRVQVLGGWVRVQGGCVRVQVLGGWVRSHEFSTLVPSVLVVCGVLRERQLFDICVDVMQCRNVVFFAGSLLGVLVVMTIIQEDLLTAHNMLVIISLLGML